MAGIKYQQETLIMYICLIKQQRTYQGKYVEALREFKIELKSRRSIMSSVKMRITDTRAVN